mmetsp:Transcript_51035/g.142805  ORF Transcript_51035/g.142805 Transcript_51035/m.142805 type:complete len:204 (-) Transcript_51035:514-1125(-)
MQHRAVSLRGPFLVATGAPDFDRLAVLHMRTSPDLLRHLAGLMHVVVLPMRRPLPCQTHGDGGRGWQIRGRFGLPINAMLPLPGASEPQCRGVELGNVRDLRHRRPRWWLLRAEVAGARHEFTGLVWWTCKAFAEPHGGRTEAMVRALGRGAGRHTRGGLRLARGTPSDFHSLDPPTPSAGRATCRTCTRRLRRNLGALLLRS